MIVERIPERGGTGTSPEGNEGEGDVTGENRCRRRVGENGNHRTASEQRRESVRERETRARNEREREIEMREREVRVSFYRRERETKHLMRSDGQREDQETAPENMPGRGWRQLSRCEPHQVRTAVEANKREKEEN